jgi:hypothetical protein
MQHQNARGRTPIPLDLLECRDAEKVCKFMASLFLRRGERTVSHIRLQQFEA